MFWLLCLAFHCFGRMLSQSEAVRTLVPQQPYTKATTFAFCGLCGEHPTLATSPHHHTTTRHNDIHRYSTSSDAPYIKVGSIFRSPKELHAAAYRRFLEAGRGCTAGNGAGRQKKYSFLRQAPVATREKKTNLDAPPHVRVCTVCTDIWLDVHTVRTRSLPIYILVVLAGIMRIRSGSISK